MLIDSRTIYAAKLNLRVPVRLQAKKCPLLANTYCTDTGTQRWYCRGTGVQGPPLRARRREDAARRAGTGFLTSFSI